MARGIERLTARKVMEAKKPFVSDGGGLYLQTRDRAKSFIYQYVDDYGKVRNMGLGSANAHSLAEAQEALDRAREKARECRRQRAAGIDPMEAREKAAEERREAAARDKTFRDAAEGWMKRSRPGWSETRAKNVRYFFEKFAYPAIGHLPIQKFDVRQDKTGIRHVTSVIEPIWLSKFTTAKQLQENIYRTLQWAMAQDWLPTGPNAADYKNGEIRHLLPEITHIPEHYAYLPYQQVGEFMKKLRDHRDAGNRRLKVGPAVKSASCKVCTSPQLEEINAAKRAGATIKNLEARFGIGWNAFFHHFAKHDPGAADLNTTRREKAAYCLELAVLCAVRKSQARTAKWSEIDLEDGIWRCSQHKLTKKTRGMAYVVALSRQAIAVLNAMKAYQEANGIKTDYVFPGSSGKKCLSHAACNKFLRVSLGYSPEIATVHGFRSTFAEWAEEETDFEEKDSEMALGHKIGDSVRNIYKRNTKRIKKRVPLMQAWADYCDGVQRSADVVPLHARKEARRTS